jgi:transcriptional regulator with XRE-family HTH domain
MPIEEMYQQEIGNRLSQVREAAGISQAELARRITWSPAVLSRVESGERQLSPDELRRVMEAIGTAEALQLSSVLEREWHVIARPPLDHPDQDLLWETEQVCRDLTELKSQPEVRHAFERRLTEYVEDLKGTANLLLKREHEVVFIGSKGVGKSTAICKLTGLEVASSDGGPAIPVLEAGGGGVTICEVHLRSGPQYGLLIEPCSDEKIRADVTDFAEHILKGNTADADDSAEGEDLSQGISAEIDRAVRNMAGLKIRREKGPDGKMTRSDEAKELALRAPSVREYVVEVLARMTLHRRDRRDIWYDPSAGKAPLAWLKETFEQVNNGRHPEFTLPARIEVVVPDRLLGTNDLTVRLVDTKGIDRTAARADLERHLNEPHTLALLCSGFNDAPAADPRLLLERSKDAAIRNLERNVALLVLPHPNQALAVKDEAGIRVQNIQEGYELKREHIAMALEPLKMQGLTIGFFNSFGDEPTRLRSLLLDCLDKIRQSFRTHIQKACADARALLLNHEKEQVQEVLHSAALMMSTCIAQVSTVPTLSGHVHESLMSQIQSAYASTIRASVRREGEWINLSYGHHLGYGARRLAVLALEPFVNKFKSATEVIEANPEYQEAKGLIQQARHVLDGAFEELLRRAQIMGETVFKDALKVDPSFWLDCENEWGKGRGYRDRVADRNQVWFGADARKELEKELWDMVKREWSVTLTRLSSLLGTDAPANISAAA